MRRVRASLEEARIEYPPSTERETLISAFGKHRLLLLDDRFYVPSLLILKRRDQQEG
jgi:hypothetical protein